MSNSLFVRRTLTVIALVCLVLFAWQIRAVLLMFFGAVVAATLFRSIADPVRRHLRLPQALAVLVAAALVFGAVGIVLWLFGSEMLAQAQQLSRRLPLAWDSLLARVQAIGVDPASLRWEQLTRGQGTGHVLSSLADAAVSVGSASANVLVIIFGGMFIASKPDFYRIGAIKLVPGKRRQLVAEAVREGDQALRLWLKAQVVGMILVGLLTGLGLWWVGVPSAAMLGLLAGLFEFIPFAGPILSAIPGLMIALAESPDTALWALLVYVIVQHGEAYLIYPLIQQWAVTIPPAVLLFSLIAMATVFGPLGIIFAAPLTVVGYVLVKRLYVIEALDTPTPIPGEDQ